MKYLYLVIPGLVFSFFTNSLALAQSTSSEVVVLEFIATNGPGSILNDIRISNLGNVYKADADQNQSLGQKIGELSAADQVLLEKTPNTIKAGELIPLNCHQRPNPGGFFDGYYLTNSTGRFLIAEVRSGQSFVLPNRDGKDLIDLLNLWAGLPPSSSQPIVTCP